MNMDYLHRLTTTKDVAENNKIIAEFMGGIYKEVFFCGVRENKFYMLDSHITEYITDFEQDLPYHKDWNLLMDVIDKIEQDESLAVMFMTSGWDNRGKFQVCIYKCFDMKENRERKPIIEKQGNIKIDVAYLAVIEFIKLYNLKTF